MADEGRTAIITGGTGGIGIHTAIGIAKTGARVIVTGRSRDRVRLLAAAFVRSLETVEWTSFSGTSRPSPG